MSFYIGFLKKNKKHAVVFRSEVIPKKKDLVYFVKVLGPYPTESAARIGLRDLKSFGYTENPIKGIITKGGIRKAIGITRKVLVIYGKIRKKNPGKMYHDRKFIQYMHDLRKHVIGSVGYMITITKAHEHLQSVKDS